VDIVEKKSEFASADRDYLREGVYRNQRDEIVAKYRLEHPGRKRHRQRPGVKI